MSNSLTALNPEVWAKKMQVVREKYLVAEGFCNYELRSSLKEGDRAHKPYRSKMSGQTYTKGTDVSIQDVTATDDYLDVDTAKVVPFYIDDIDKIQNSFNTKDDFRTDAMNDLNEIVDADVLGEYTNATSDLYAADIGESGATTPIVASQGNILRVLSKSNAKLHNYRVKGKRIAVFSPTMVSMLQLYLSGKDTVWGDKVGKNGTVDKVMNTKILMSDNLTLTAKWTPADQPSDGDTLTIGGTTITFKTTLTSADDQVKSETNVATTLDNLVAYLNQSGTDGTEYSTMGDDAAAAFQGGMTATDGATYITIEWQGGGESTLDASETADPWSEQVLHALYLEEGSIDLVMQKYPTVDFRYPDKKLGVNILPYMLYGKKTFTKNKNAIVDINVDQNEL